MGDVVAIPLNGKSEYGAGRIMMKDGTATLVEFYKIEPISTMPSIEQIKDAEVMLTIWCVNRYITSGLWERIGNIEVDLDYVQPKYYDNKMHRVIINPFQNDSITTDYDSEEEVRKSEDFDSLQPYGMCGELLALIKYINKLQEYGLCERDQEYIDKLSKS